MEPQNQQTPPPTSNQNPAPGANQPPPQVVYVTRPITPGHPPLTPEDQKRHEDSKAKYPQLNLSAGEYVISAVKRHPFGLFQIWAISGLIIGVLVLFVALLLSNNDSVNTLNSSTGNALPLLTIPLLLVAVLVLIGGAIGTYVYQQNTFYLTNESVIQNVQTSLFTKRLQTVSLGNIEDASYTKHGIIDHMFNFGYIRLSTEGDETTYRFRYASEPEKQVAILNNAVEAFKNGRPVQEF